METPLFNKVHVVVGSLLALIFGALFYQMTTNLTSSVSLVLSILGLLFIVSYSQGPQRDTTDLRDSFIEVVPLKNTNQSCFLCSKHGQVQINESTELVLFGRGVLTLKYQQDVICEEHSMSTENIQNQFDKELNEAEQKKRFLGE